MYLRWCAFPGLEKRLIVAFKNQKDINIGKTTTLS